MITIAKWVALMSIEIAAEIGRDNVMFSLAPGYTKLNLDWKKILWWPTRHNLVCIVTSYMKP